MGSEMRKFIAGLACAQALTLGGCDLARSVGFGDGDVVISPAYSANRLMLLEPSADPQYSRLRYPAERPNPRDPSDTRQPVLNRQPISIIISKVHVPTSLAQCINRLSDPLFQGKRDIAVLLDTATQAGPSTALAVWYETGISPGQYLTFENLLVYSTAAWDSRFPPYFRVRLIDVTAERNAATRSALDTVRENGPRIGTLLQAPGASPLISAASEVGKLVLANERNVALLDFTFQLFGEQLAAGGGGAPLGVLQTGGMILTAPPCPAEGEPPMFPRGRLRHDNFEFQIVNDDNVALDMPFVYATILSADLAVPDVVRDRSTAIMARLSGPAASASQIDEALKSVGELQASLAALSARERFRTTPNLNSLENFINQAVVFAPVPDDASTPVRVDASVESFLLTALYQATGKVLESPDAYKTWFDNCKGVLDFDIQAGRAIPANGAVGADGNACW